MKKISAWRPYMALIILLSCNSQKKVNGDWITSKNTTENILIFSFSDSTCSYIYPYGNFSKFHIQNDTLTIEVKERDATSNNQEYQFLINKLTNKELHLSPISAVTSKLFHPFRNLDTNPLVLHKIVKKNSLNFERIGFYSTTCFGICPAMYLEIDKTGEFIFYGGPHTEQQGYYSGKISKEVIELLSKKINQVPLDSLKSRYKAGWSDDQSCGIKITSSKKSYTSSVYGVDKEPIELRVLFHILMELHNTTELQYDTAAFNKFEFKEFMLSRHSLFNLN